MPIFEFSCDQCGKQFERLVFKSDEPVSCPACGQDKVTKLMSACAFKADYHGMMKTTSSKGSSCTGCSSTSCSTCG